MADGRILAGAGFPQARKAAGRLCDWRPAGHAVQIEKAQFRQMFAFEIGVLRDGRQRIGPCITELRGVRLRTDSEAVQHDQKNSFCHI